MSSKTIYDNCCLKDTYCGPFNKIKTPLCKVYKIRELNDPIENHFEELRLIHELKENSEYWNEKKLVENRVGKSFEDDEEVCPHHRYYKGNLITGASGPTTPKMLQTCSTITLLRWPCLKNFGPI